MEKGGFGCIGNEDTDGRNSASERANAAIDGSAGSFVVKSHASESER